MARCHRLRRLTATFFSIPVVVFANFVGQPVDQVGGYFARFMPVISMHAGMLWIVGGGNADDRCQPCCPV
jgi:hypothetical protein